MSFASLLGPMKLIKKQKQKTIRLSKHSKDKKVESRYGEEERNQGNMDGETSTALLASSPHHPKTGQTEVKLCQTVNKSLKGASHSAINICLCLLRFFKCISHIGLHLDGYIMHLLLCRIKKTGDKHFLVTATG